MTKTEFICEVLDRFKLLTPEASERLPKGWRGLRLRARIGKDGRSILDLTIYDPQGSRRTVYEWHLVQTDEGFEATRTVAPMTIPDEVMAATWCYVEHFEALENAQLAMIEAK